MSEATPPQRSASTPATRPAVRRRPPIKMVAGVGLALIATTVGFLQLRAEPAAPQASAAAQATSASIPAGQVLGRVNETTITYEQVANEAVRRYGAEILDNMINRTLIHQACQQRGVVVTSDEVEAEITKMAGDFNIPADTYLKMLETERGLSPDQYRRDIIWPMLALKKLAGTEVQVSAAQMQRAFERDYGPRVKARMIMIDGNIRHANKVWEECQRTPEDFDRLARKYSNDSNTRPLGGVIPPIRRNAGHEKLEEEAFRMRVGEISPVIQVAENRYLILKCEGHTDPIVTDVNDVAAEVRKQLVDEQTQQAVASVFTQIRQQAKVINHLTGETTGRSPFPAGSEGRTNIQQTSGRAAPQAANR